MRQYLIKNTKKYGRGLYRSKNASVLPKGTVLMINELLVFSPKDTKKVNKTELSFYTFAYNSKQDCLCLGDGELFNHSDNPNVTYSLENRESRKVMVFRTIRAIQPGEQLFINYTQDCPIDADKYINVNMVG